MPTFRCSSVLTMDTQWLLLQAFCEHVICTGSLENGVSVSGIRKNFMWLFNICFLAWIHVNCFNQSITRQYIVRLVGFNERKCSLLNGEVAELEQPSYETASILGKIVTSQSYGLYWPLVALTTLCNLYDFCCEKADNPRIAEVFQHIHASAKTCLHMTSLGLDKEIS